ncbi:MAG: S8 family serine peptidase [Firmicutes bacterium]|nr:S8 family serine peptidase [Bacillota bacterium]MCL5038511.1 S8 family serine peptidase [Bacillota bacterium]
MQKWLAVLVSLLLIFLQGVPAQGAGSAWTGGNTGQVPGELVVKFRTGLSGTEMAETLRLNRASIKGYIPALGVKVLRIPAGLESVAAQQLMASGQVLYAEPNYLAQATYLPNDPYYAGDYQTSRDGRQHQWALPKVNAPAAWDVTRSLNTGLLLAIIDTGIDYAHPDLSAKVARDSAGQVLGYNFVANTADPRDDNGHGTHVSGIAAAATDNSTGIAGISFNSVKIMPIKVLDAAGSGTYSVIVNAIVWAADNGARVISMSLGGGSYSQALQDACNYAWAKGVAIVAASGNDGRKTISYPGGNNHVLAVGASDEQDAIASFSNWGIDVGFAAPGVHILSTMPTYDVNLTTASGFYKNYDSLSGTSMATPFVGGLAAMLLAQNPSQSNVWALQQIQRTADNVSGTANGGWNIHYGYGRINAANAVTNSLRPATVGSFYGQVVNQAGLPVSSATVTAGGLSYKTGSNGMFRLANLPAGNYTVTAKTARYGTASVNAAITSGADVILTVRTPK